MHDALVKVWRYGPGIAARLVTWITPSQFAQDTALFAAAKAGRAQLQRKTPIRLSESLMRGDWSWAKPVIRFWPLERCSVFEACE
jgi:hypothetical protein